MNSNDLWQRYRDHLWVDAELGLRLDISRMNFPDGFLEKLAQPMAKAFAAMAALEKGAIANPDENRMVGHYWLRAPELAPDPGIRTAIEETGRSIRAFARAVHEGRIKPQQDERFTHLLVIGIGGSALGPQLVAHALGGYEDHMTPWFVDNTDPDGVDYVLRNIGHELKRTLTVVISKSGGTKETRNGMLEVKAAYERKVLDFGRHAVAVTGDGSQLDSYAEANGFLQTFPMWDWVGGRTSELSAVGLLPAALQGIDTDAMIEGAAAMDRITRSAEITRNPAALLAAMWHFAGNGRGDRQMVVLPYKDRLLLFSRYLQQLVMESLGKEKNLDGETVHQGLTVFGNKGSTDQHAYVQQLRDGRDDFFVTFIEVLKDREGPSSFVEENATSGDFLVGFLLGTRRALHESGRGSITLTLPDTTPRSLGMLIALYERAVGLYASLVGVNAYHQPGVEAGKKAATQVLDLQIRALKALGAETGRGWSASELAEAIDAPEEVETLFQVLEHLASNPDHGIRREPRGKPWEAIYRLESSRD